MTPKTAINRAAEIVGGQSSLARMFDPPVTPQAVGYWCRTGNVPGSRVLTIEACVDYQVTRYDLRPDLYPRSNAAA